MVLWTRVVISNRNDGEQIHSACVLDVGSSGVDNGCKKKKGVKNDDKVFGLSSWKDGITID